VTAPAPAARGSGTCACGQLPVAHFETPVPIIKSIATTNPYVGIAKAIPDSLTPRRFTKVRSRTNRSDSATLCASKDGAADDHADTPAPPEAAAGGIEAGRSAGGREGPGRGAGVVTRDALCAAVRLVRLPRLRVEKDDDPQDRRDRNRDRQYEMARRCGGG